MFNPELILFISLMLAAYSAYSILKFFLTSNVDTNILSWASGQEPVKSKSPLVNASRPLVHQFTLQHALKIKSPAYRSNIERLLETSGLNRELNVDEFIGLQILWGVFFPTFISIMNFALDMGFSWFLVLLIFPLGAYFPFIYAKQQKGIRELSVRGDLPFFTDLLALSTVGLDFIAAIQRISEKAEGSVLGEELGIVLKDIKLGSSRSDALKGLGRRIDLPEITSFVSVLIDADATGASISQVLKDQANQIRMERFVRAEKAGARASQTMLFALIFFIMPAVFIVVMGPMAVQFMSGGGVK